MRINTMVAYNKNRTISVIITLFTFLTLIFCCSHICEAASAKLIWDESPETNVTGYYIYYGTEPGIYTNSKVVGKSSNTGYLIEDLGFTPDQTYYIAVTAYMDTDESTYSNEVIYSNYRTDPAYYDTLDYSLIPQSQLSILSVDSEELKIANRPAENAIDGLSDTFWHTEWYRSDPVCPHEIIIDLGNLYAVGGFQYLPRQDGKTYGTVADYSIYVSKDGITWGEAVATGTFTDDTTEKEVTFTRKIGRYIRFVALSEINGNPWTSAAEINILGMPADSDGDGITDSNEIDIYGTDPDKADTDGDGISDYEEVALWGDDWDADYDSDEIINLLDPDADGDGISDGEEIELGTDPAYPDALDYSFIPQSQLSIVSVDSEELAGEDGAAENAIDGLSDTFWHTEWYRSDPVCPHEIIIDLGNLYAVGGFQYLPRQDGKIYGTVADYNIYVSKDEITWGEAVAAGTFAGDTTEKEVTFTGKIGRYIRFVALSEINGNPWTNAAEINILGSVLP